MIDHAIYVVFLHYVDHGEQLGFISCTMWIDYNSCLEHCVEMEFVSALWLKRRREKLISRKSNWKCAYQMFDIFAADQITIIKYLYLNHFIGFV